MAEVIAQCLPMAPARSLRFLILKARGYRPSMQVEAIRRLGEAIRERRTAAGYSQVAFAEIADVDRQYLSRLERGLQNPSLLLVMRIAVELDVTLVDLLGGIRLDAAEIRSIERLSRGPRPVGKGPEQD